MMMDLDLQLDAGGYAYAKPYVHVGAFLGVDEAVFETASAIAEDRDERYL